MVRKRFTAEQIIMKLREAEVGLAQGQTVGQVCKQIGVTEQTYYRWRKEYGGLRLNQAKRLKVLEKENARLKKLARIDHRFGNEGDFGRPERFSESFAIDPVQVE